MTPLKQQLANAKSYAEKAQLCFEAVKQNGLALEFVPEKFKTAKLCLEAVKQNGLALKFVPCYALRRKNRKTFEVCLEAVKQNWDAIWYAPTSYTVQGILQRAVKQGGKQNEK